jgi:hypothetical protein
VAVGSSHLPHHAPLTDPHIRHPIRWRVVAFFWDAPIASLLLALDFLVFYFASNNFWLVFFAILVSIVYFMGAIFVYGAVSDCEYPWYLTRKVKADSVWQWYWYDKVRFRFRRFLRLIFTSGRGNLFVRIQALRTSESRGDPVAIEDMPGLMDLLRAFRQRDHEMQFLLKSEDMWDRILAETPVLERAMQDSISRPEAYLRYQTRVYFSFPEKERRLIREHQEVSVWEWLDRSPTRSWLFRFVVVFFIGLILYQVLRIVFFPIG